MGEFFPELEKQKGLAIKVIKDEEQNFLRTLYKGIDKFNAYANTASEIVVVRFAFELLIFNFSLAEIKLEYASTAL